jgi:Bacterial toxin 5
MGDHSSGYPVDQTVQHDKDAHASIHDDGRTLRDEGLVYHAGYPVAVPAPGTQVAFVFRDKNKLIPETLHVHPETVIPTTWESLYSVLFGTGTEERYDFPVNDGPVAASFSPVIDDGSQVVGHVGWVDGYEICVPVDTIRDGCPFAKILEARRLGPRQLPNMVEFGRSDRGPFLDPSNPFPSPRLDAIRYGPPGDPSEEARRQNNINFFVAGGGKVVIGRQFASELLAGLEYESLMDKKPPKDNDEDFWDLINPRDFSWKSDYRFLVLVSPDGHLQVVLKVERVSHEPPSKFFRVAVAVVDIALFVWMVIDIVTLPIVLAEMGTALAARATAMRAAKLRLNEMAAEALKAAELEAKRLAEAEARTAAEEAAAKAAREPAGAGGKFKFGVTTEEEIASRGPRRGGSAINKDRGARPFNSNRINRLPIGQGVRPAISRIPAFTGTKEQFRDYVLAKLRREKNNPLRFLLTQKGEFRTVASRTHPALMNNPRVWEAGHIMSDKIGGNRLMIQTAWENQVQSATVEASHIGGAALDNPAVEVGGLPVAKSTVKWWEREGLLPAGTAESAPIIR